MNNLFPQLDEKLADLRIWETEVTTAYLNERHPDEAHVLRDILTSPRFAVALYGPTKAGKTTLILKLLGVDETSIGRILRGNEDHEKTGTPTAIIYFRSPDDNAWYVTGDDLCRTRIEDDAGAKSWLDNIRKRMEGRVEPRFDSGKPLKIEIPGRHFHTSTPLGNQEIELIDLPGHSGGDSNEVRHAQSLYDAIAKNASLILHVYPAANLTSAGALTQFKSGSVLLDEWWNFPNKSRLVLTRTVTAESVRWKLEELIRNGAADDALRSWLKSHVHSELNRSGVPLHEAELVFPLEYGMSWAQCCETEAGKAYHDRIEGVFSSDYAEITNLIIQSNQPRPLFDHISPKSTELHYKKRLADLHQQRSEVAQSLDAARTDLSAAETRLGEIRNDLEYWKNKISHFRDHNGHMKYWLWNLDWEQAYNEHGHQYQLRWKNGWDDATRKDSRSDDDLTGHVNYWRDTAVQELRNRVTLFNRFTEHQIGLGNYHIHADSVIWPLNLWDRTWQSVDRQFGGDPTDWNQFCGFTKPAWGRKRERAAHCSMDIIYAVANAYNDHTCQTLNAIAKRVDDEINHLGNHLIPSQERTVCQHHSHVDSLQNHINHLSTEIDRMNHRIAQLNEMQRDFRQFLSPYLSEKMRQYAEQLGSAQANGNLGHMFTLGAVRHHLQSQISF